MEEFFDDVIIMKVGPHSGMNLQEIIDSKVQEEKKNGVHYWGYSGVFCKPIPTQKFCQESKRNNHNPKIILIETKSSYNSEIGFIDEYSEDNVTYKKFKAPAQLQGAEFSFVAKNIRKVKSFRLDDFKVVGGKNNGRLVSEHLVFRVNKCFGKYNGKGNIQEKEVYVADLVEPYAILLKRKIGLFYNRFYIRR